MAEVQKNGQRSHILTEEEKRERKRRHAEYEKMRRKNMPSEKKVEWNKREAERLKRNRDRSIKIYQLDTHNFLVNMNRWKREHANPEAWEKTRQKKRARYERRWNSLTEEQQDEIRRKRTERAKERLAKMSEEERQKYLERQKESKRHYLMKSEDLDGF